MRCEPRRQANTPSSKQGRDGRGIWSPFGWRRRLSCYEREQHEENGTHSRGARNRELSSRGKSAMEHGGKTYVIFTLVLTA